MSDSRAAVRILVTIALILLPLILVALTLEPLEPPPARKGRTSQIVVDRPQDGSSSPAAGTPIT
jgi:hypothetical protein